MAHFTGQSIVWRGPWHIEVPLDFHFYLNPEADEKYEEAALKVLAALITESYVAEQEASMYNPDDEDDYEDQEPLGLA